MKPTAWMHPTADLFAKTEEAAKSFGCTIPLYATLGEAPGITVVRLNDADVSALCALNGCAMNGTGYYNFLIEKCAKVYDERANTWDGDPPVHAIQAYGYRNEEAENCAKAIRALKIADGTEYVNDSAD